VAWGALGGERTGLSLQSIDPGGRRPFGHRHGEEEEVYVVLSGAGTIRVGDEEIALAELDAVRVAPGAPRALEAGPDGLRFIAFGSPGSGGADAETMPGWWGD
jgi:mannose-6-phosphate isomerase-like protein (cupin superfamily)